MTPKNPETTVCASSGMQNHVSQSLGKALTPNYMAIILSRVHHFRYLELFDLFDPVILVYLVNKRYFS